MDEHEAIIRAPPERRRRAIAADSDGMGRRFERISGERFSRARALVDGVRLVGHAAARAASGRPEGRLYETRVMSLCVVLGARRGPPSGPPASSTLHLIRYDRPG